MTTIVGVPRVRPVSSRSNPSDTRPNHSSVPVSSPNVDASAVLAAHRTPPRPGATCTGCGHVWTEKSPFCPSYVAALRSLAAPERGSRQGRRSLTTLDSDALLAVADAHTGDHRCARCGFTYTTRVRSCPTYRQVRAVLESRGVLPITHDPDRRACAEKGAGWNVATRTRWNLAGWKAAMAACRTCPFLTQCTAELQSRIDAGEPPHGEIVAATLFPPDGAEPVPWWRIDDYGQRHLDRRRSQKKRTRTYPGESATESSAA